MTNVARPQIRVVARALRLGICGLGVGQGQRCRKRERRGARLDRAGSDLEVDRVWPRSRCRTNWYSAGHRHSGSTQLDHVWVIHRGTGDSAKGLRDSSLQNQRGAETASPSSAIAECCRTAPRSGSRFRTARWPAQRDGPGARLPSGGRVSNKRHPRRLQGQCLERRQRREGCPTS